MAILDLIRKYGNRQVVRQKDKAIIELSENGGSNNQELDANFFVCGNFPTGEVEVSKIPIFYKYKIKLMDENQVEYLGNLENTPPVFYFSMTTEDFEQYNNKWVYGQVADVSNITDANTADIYLLNEIPEGATVCLFKAEKTNRSLIFPRNRDVVLIEVIAYTTENPK